MSLEITGKLLVKYDTQEVSERFRKREFVLELSDEVGGNVYTNYAKMQLVQGKCELLDQYQVGDLVKVNFNIKGTKWERDGKINYITNLDAWRIEHAQSQAPAASPQPSFPAAEPAPFNYNVSQDSADDLPF
jgi:hypothetical protein